MFGMIQIKNKIAVSLRNDWIIRVQAFLEFGLAVVFGEIGNQKIRFIGCQPGKSPVKVLDVGRKRPGIGFLPAIIGQWVTIVGSQRNDAGLVADGVPNLGPEGGLRTVVVGALDQVLVNSGESESEK